MKLISWNVNGIRATTKKGLLEYIRESAPDILALQEVKAQEHENPLMLDLHSLGYTICWNAAERA